MSRLVLPYAVTDNLAHPRRKRLAWIPAMVGVLLIAVESTGRLGSAHTRVMLLHFLNLFYLQQDTESFEQAHHLLRKAGHLVGYGVLGVLLARAWSTQIDRRTASWRIYRWSAIRVRGCFLALISAFAVACADEFHQSFTPGRTALFSDVLLDTAGAFTFVAAMLGLLSLQRPGFRAFLLKLRHRTPNFLPGIVPR